ncbi:Leishmanolysin [Novymonas esmeraldas]|uniref:Leishmanolysin-like peptidase n=1 Tax=Novymonas esmeraldas TaxID=1808958 RepID=A0AAW0F094_9TRYP
MRHSLLSVALVASLLYVAVCGWTRQRAPKWADVEEHRCRFDELQARMISTRTSLVGDVSRKRSVVTASAEWQPIRIAVFTGDVAASRQHCTKAGQRSTSFTGHTVTCEADDVLTSTKKQILLDLLIPSTVQLHEEHLHVQREGGNIVVNSLVKEDPFCRQFSIPAAHKKAGVANADFVLYMSVRPTTQDTVAWATTCQYFTNGRPAVGVANVSPRYISDNLQMMRVVALEMLHALGFNVHNFQARSMVSSVSVRVAGSVSVPVINSPSVSVRAQHHFGCSTPAYLKLDSLGGTSTKSSPELHLSAKDKLTAGSDGAGVYSALTIAAMEDLGYYRGSYSMAEPIRDGNDPVGELATEKHTVNGVSLLPEVFCTFVFFFFLFTTLFLNPSD